MKCLRNQPKYDFFPKEYSRYVVTLILHLCRYYCVEIIECYHSLLVFCKLCIPFVLYRWKNNNVI